MYIGVSKLDIISGNGLVLDRIQKEHIAMKNEFRNYKDSHIKMSHVMPTRIVIQIATNT